MLKWYIDQEFSRQKVIYSVQAVKYRLDIQD